MGLGFKFFFFILIFFLNNSVHNIVDIIAFLTQEKKISNVFVGNGITFDVINTLRIAPDILL